MLQEIFAQRRHPIWTAGASTVLVATGFAILWAGLPIVVVALVLYGSGIGISSIVRGTLPLALFGPSGYAVLMGRLGTFSFIAQALSPSIAAALLERVGAAATVGVLMALAVLNVVIVAMLALAARRSIVVAT